MTPKEELALAVAKYYHGNAYRKSPLRKYTGKLYIEHPMEVRDIVKKVDHDEDMLCASLLHDTIEDTYMDEDMINMMFGNGVAILVYTLTDITNPEDGNRKARKRIELERLALSSSRAQTIKVADMISNTSSIVERDVKFAKVYVPEAIDLLLALDRADPELRGRLGCQLQEAAERIGGI